MAARVAVAQYAWSGSNSSEDNKYLSFTAGARIEIVEEREEGGWWAGRLEGRLGWFPSSFCTVESATPTAPAPAAATAAPKAPLLTSALPAEKSGRAQGQSNLSQPKPKLQARPQQESQSTPALPYLPQPHERRNAASASAAKATQSAVLPCQPAMSSSFSSDPLGVLLSGASHILGGRSDFNPSAPTAHSNPTAVTRGSPAKAMNAQRAAVGHGHGAAVAASPLARGAPALASLNEKDQLLRAFPKQASLSAPPRAVAHGSVVGSGGFGRLWEESAFLDLFVDCSGGSSPRGEPEGGGVAALHGAMSLVVRVL